VRKEAETKVREKSLSARIGALVCHSSILRPRISQRLGALGNSRLLRLIFDTAALRYESVRTVSAKQTFPYQWWLVEFGNRERFPFLRKSLRINETAL